MQQLAACAVEQAFRLFAVDALRGGDRGGVLEAVQMPGVMFEVGAAIEAETGCENSVFLRAQ